jgi:hypothetical protein
MKSLNERSKLSFGILKENVLLLWIGQVGSEIFLA